MEDNTYNDDFEEDWIEDLIRMPQREMALVACYMMKRSIVMNEEFHERIRLAIEEITEAIRTGNEIIKRTRPRVYAEQEVFEELVNIGIEEGLLFTAYDFLVENPTRVRAFFGCPSKERKNYLMWKMNKEGNKLQWGSITSGQHRDGLSYDLVAPRQNPSSSFTMSAVSSPGSADKMKGMF